MKYDCEILIWNIQLKINGAIQKTSKNIGNENILKRLFTEKMSITHGYIYKYNIMYCEMIK